MSESGSSQDSEHEEKCPDVIFLDEVKWWFKDQFHTDVSGYLLHSRCHTEDAEDVCRCAVCVPCVNDESVDERIMASRNELLEGRIGVFPILSGRFGNF